MENQVIGLFDNKHEGNVNVVLVASNGNNKGVEKELVFRHGVDDFASVCGFEDLEFEVQDEDGSLPTTAVRSLTIGYNSFVKQSDGHMGVVPLVDGKFLMFELDEVGNFTAETFSITASGLLRESYTGKVRVENFDADDSFILEEIIPISE